MLDLWSIAHFILGMAFGRLPFIILSRRAIGLPDTSKSPRKITIAHGYFFVLSFAYCWEALEFALEAGVAGPAVGFWLQGHEHLVNRIITDPALVLMGYWFSNTHAPWIFWPSRVALLIWSWVFLVIMPHSMAYTG